MKKCLYYLCSLMIILFMGCRDSKEETFEELFSVSPTSIDADATGGQKSVSVKASGPWDVSCNDGWIHLDKTAGSGNKTLSFTIEENKASNRRTATITLTEYSSKTAINVSINQEGMNYSLSVDSSSLSYAYNETESKTIHVKSNDDWTVTSSDSWIKTDKIEGTHNDSFSISLSGENNETTPREGTVTVKSKNSKASATIKVSQNSKGFDISVKPDSWSVSSSDAANKVFNVYSNDSWSVTSDKEWLTILKGSESGSGDGNFTAEVTENQSKESRTGHITLKGDNSKSISIEVTQPAKGYNLVVKPEEISDVDANGAEKVIDVTSNDSWTVSTSVSWLSTSKSSGSNDGSFTVTIKANTNTSPRDGKITITGEKSGFKKTIKVGQRGVDYNLTVNPEFISASSDAMKQTVTISSNESWTISKSNDSWITLDKTSGSGNGSFNVSISANNSATSRNGSITVKGTDSGKTITITVSQSGVGFNLEVSPSSVSANADGKSQTITVTSNDSWTVTSNNSWITVSKSSGSGSSTFTASISKNTDTSSRSGSITVKGSNSGTKTITVTQEGKDYTLTVSPESISTDYKGTTKNIQVKSNDSWTVSTSNGWFTVSKTKGSGDDSFTVTIGERTSTTTHEGTITVKGVNSGITRTIKITQTGVDYNLSVSPTSLTANADGETKSISVSSNDSWTVSKSDWWITVSRTSGSGDGTFSATIAENTSVSSRSGSITVKGTNSGTTKTITISQDGKANLSIEDFGNDNELKAKIR